MNLKHPHVFYICSRYIEVTWIDRLAFKHREERAKLSKTYSRTTFTQQMRPRADTISVCHKLTACHIVTIFKFLSIFFYHFCIIIYLSPRSTKIEDLKSVDPYPQSEFVSRLSARKFNNGCLFETTLLFSTKWQENTCVVFGLKKKKQNKTKQKNIKHIAW